MKIISFEYIIDLLFLENVKVWWSADNSSDQFRQDLMICSYLTHGHEPNIVELTCLLST